MLLAMVTINHSALHELSRSQRNYSYSYESSITMATSGGGDAHQGQPLVALQLRRDVVQGNHVFVREEHVMLVEYLR